MTAPLGDQATNIHPTQSQHLRPSGLVDSLVDEPHLVDSLVDRARVGGALSSEAISLVRDSPGTGEGGNTCPSRTLKDSYLADTWRL